MSRIGRLPVELPANVTAEVNPGNEVVIKGPKGELKQKFSNKVEIKLDGNVISVSRAVSYTHLDFSISQRGQERICRNRAGIRFAGRRGRRNAAVPGE